MVQKNKKANNKKIKNNEKSGQDVSVNDAVGDVSRADVTDDKDDQFMEKVAKEANPKDSSLPNNNRPSKNKNITNSSEITDSSDEDTSDDQKSNITNINEQKAFKASYPILGSSDEEDEEEELEHIDDELISNLVVSGKYDDGNNNQADDNLSFDKEKKVAKTGKNNIKTNENEVHTNINNISKKQFIDSVKRRHSMNDDKLENTYRKVEISSDSENMKTDVEKDQSISNDEQGAEEDILIDKLKYNSPKRISKQVVSSKGSSYNEENDNKSKLSHDKSKKKQAKPVIGTMITEEELEQIQRDTAFEKIRNFEDSDNNYEIEAFEELKSRSGSGRIYDPAFIEEINQKPSSLPFLVALIITIAIIASAGAYIWGFYGQKMIAAESILTILSAPDAISLASAFILPIPVIWLLAIMIRRSQELKKSSLSLAKAAVELAMPEGIAKEAVASVGQSIRREVSAMSDGIERVLKRAEEIETLVNSEVASLEISYRENEGRVKNVLGDLTKERTSIENTSIVMAQELHPVINRLREENRTLHSMIDDATKILKKIDIGLGGSIDKVRNGTETFDKISGNALEKINSNMEQLQSFTKGNYEKTIEVTNQFIGNTKQYKEISGKLYDVNENMTAMLQQQHNKIDTISGSFITNLDQIFDKRIMKLDDWVNLFSQSLDNIVKDKRVEIENLSNYFDNIQTSVEDWMESYINTFDGRLASIESRMVEASDSMIENSKQSEETISQGSKILQEEIEMQTRSLLNEFRTQYEEASREMSEDMQQTSKKLASSVSEVRDALNHLSREPAQMLSSDIENLNNNLASSMKEIRDTLNLASRESSDSINKELGNATRKLDQFSNEIKSLVGSLTSELEKASDDLKNTLGELPIEAKKNIDNIGKTMSNHIKALDNLKMITGKFNDEADMYSPSSSDIYREASDIALSNLDDRSHSEDIRSDARRDARDARGEGVSRSEANDERGLEFGRRGDTGQSSRFVGSNRPDDNVKGEIRSRSQENIQAFGRKGDKTPNNDEKSEERTGGFFSRRSASQNKSKEPRKRSLKDLLAAASGDGGVSDEKNSSKLGRVRDTASDEYNITRPRNQRGEAERRASDSLGRSNFGRLENDMRDNLGADENALYNSKQNTVETLNSLSVDLAKSLDNQSPLDLWRRYQTGDDSIFRRDIYTRDGRVMFDKISQKYSDDSSFKYDVDRYIDDFESLLDSASSSNKRDMLLKTYITSETGRVYLMLAHASGRIGDTNR